MVNSTLQLQNVLEHILSNYQEETYSINQLCDESGQSRFQVHRTIKATLGLSFSQLLLRIRILGSVRLLIEQNGNVSDIAYKVGFSSPSYFSKCYTTLFSEAPGKTLNSQKFPSPRNSQTRKLLSHPTVKQLLVKKGIILDAGLETRGIKILKNSKVNIYGYSNNDGTVPTYQRKGEVKVVKVKTTVTGSFRERIARTGQKI